MGVDAQIPLRPRSTSVFDEKAVAFFDLPLAKGEGFPAWPAKIRLVFADHQADPRKAAPTER